MRVLRRCRARLNRLRLHARAETGSAMVEFTYLGILLLVPLAYVLLTIFRLQNAGYAVSTATREASRAFVSAPSDDVAWGNARAAATLALRDFGLEIEPKRVQITCTHQPCLTPGGQVRVHIDREVLLPLVPRVFGKAPAAIRVEAERTDTVDRLRATP
jgi:hypothetical protein